jgi:flagella basal body P-ring formation protein FlgA
LAVCSLLWHSTAAGAPATDGGGSPSGAIRVVTTEDLDPVFREALLEYGPWPEEALEITEIQAYPEKLRIPQGELSIGVIPPSNGRYLGRVSFLLDLRVDGVPARKVRVRGRVEVYRTVASAARSLAKGHVLRPEDITLSRRPLSRLRGNVLDRLEDAVGMALKRSVRPGQIMTDRMLTPPVAVCRGDRITIIAQSPTLSISAPGEARQDGSVGDFVRVRNIMSQREIVAQILDSKTVAVSF